MFKSIWNIGQTLIGINGQLRQQREEAESLAALSMDELLPRWLEVVNSHSALSQGALRPAQKDSVICTAEERLHTSLPPELAIFYGICNGIEPLSSDFPYPFTKIESLRRCGEHVSPLSGQMRQNWKAAGYQDEGYPPALGIYPSRLLSEGDNEAEGEMAFLVTDQLLALETPRLGYALTMVIDARSAGYPVGTVLEIENLTAVRYPSLAAWMAEGIIEGSNR